MAGRRTPWGRRVALLALLVLGAWMATHSRSAGADPFAVPPPPPLPSPNGYDTLLAAIALPADRAAEEAFWAMEVSAFLEAIPERRAVARSCTARLDKLREALRQEYREPARRGQAALDLPPHFAKARDLARQLAFFEAPVRAADGDWAGAMDSCLDCLELGVALPRGSDVTGLLVGFGCEAIGRAPTIDIVPHLTAAECRRAARRLERIEAERVPLVEPVREARWAALSGLAAVPLDPLVRWRLARDAAKYLGSDYAKAALITGRRAIAAEVAQLYDQAEALAALPYAKGRQDPKGRNPMAALWSNCPVAGLQERLAQQRTFSAQLLAALAIRAYRLDHRAWPPSLEALVPEYLTAVPRDAYNFEQPLGYRPQGPGFGVWSVGPDQIDDRGRPVPPSKGRRTPASVRPDSRGDAVFGPNR